MLTAQCDYPSSHTLHRGIKEKEKGKMVIWSLCSFILICFDFDVVGNGIG